MAICAPCGDLHAQTKWIGLSTGGNLSSIRYRTSSDNLDKSLKGIPAFAASVEFRKIGASRTGFAALAGYRTATVKDGDAYVLTTYSLNHLTLGAFAEISTPAKQISYSVGMGIVGDYLVHGMQSRGFEQFDLTTSLDRLNASVAVRGATHYNISDDAFCGVIISYSRGLTNMEKDQDQTAFMNSLTASISIHFRLGQNKKRYDNKLRPK